MRRVGGRQSDVLFTRIDRYVLELERFFELVYTNIYKTITIYIYIIQGTSSLRAVY